MVARLTAHLDALLRIHPHERAPLLWLMLYATAAIGGVLTIGYSVAAALFLSQLPASATALIFAVTGAAVTITILGYNRLSAHVRIAPLVIASSLILALLTLVLRGLLATPVGDELWLLLLLNLFSEVSLTLVIMQSWSYAAQVFDPRQARRLFGIFTVGGTAANMVAGLLLSVLVGLIGTANLLYLVAASLLICGLCAWALTLATGVGAGERVRRWVLAAERPPLDRHHAAAAIDQCAHGAAVAAGHRPHLPVLPHVAGHLRW